METYSRISKSLQGTTYIYLLNGEDFKYSEIHDRKNLKSSDRAPHLLRLGRGGCVDHRCPPRKGRFRPPVLKTKSPPKISDKKIKKTVKEKKKNWRALEEVDDHQRFDEGDHLHEVLEKDFVDIAAVPGGGGGGGGREDGMGRGRRRVAAAAGDGGVPVVRRIRKATLLLRPLQLFFFFFFWWGVCVVGRKGVRPG